MKPKDLHAPFHWDARRICIEDRVWHLPSMTREDPFRFPGWQDARLFGNPHPVIIEYCSGNGTWIAEKARKYPEKNFLAVEKKFPRVRKVWSKIHNLQLENLVVACAKAEELTSRFLPSNSVSAIFINFPDPWPKKRHAKHRLLQMPFAQQMHRVLQEEGVVTIVTDDANYSSQIQEVFKEEFSPLFPEGYVTEWPDYGDSYFDALWREQGREVRYHQFKKR